MKQPSFKRPGQKGLSLIEVILTMGVLVIAVQAFATFFKLVNYQSSSFRDRTYATEKAVQMLQELRGAVGTQDVSVLENYNDGTNSGNGGTSVYRFSLTTQLAITGAYTSASQNGADKGADPFSGNPVIPGQGYKFVRTVQVQKTADPTVRKVYVRVYLAASNAGSSETGLAMPKDVKAPALAEVFGVIHSTGTSQPPVQVMDVYLIALESVPGWWARTSALQPLMDDTIYGLQARNPGLEIRRHWISRMSYGRDSEYLPEVNKATTADAYAFKKVYVYPGLIQYNDGTDNYYAPDWFQSQINVDGVPTMNNGYSIADQFNHAVRYPDEQNFYTIARSIASSNGQTLPEVSLRMLLEKMNNGDPSLLNSIVINLHGEMVPVLPLRNYADGAKDPLYYFGERSVTTPSLAHRAFRAVTQSERLYFNTAVNPAEVKVYAWDANPPGDPISVTMEADTIDVVTLFVPNASTDNLAQIQRLQGSSTVPYHWYQYASTTTGTFSAWQDNGSALYDGLSPAQGSSTFAADNYTTPDGRSGLRIQLFGVSATARAYTGQAWH